LSEGNLFNLFGLALAFFSLVLWGVQRYRDRKQDETLQGILETVKKRASLPDERAIEELIAGAMDRKREELNDKEFRALQTLAVKSYSEMLSKDALIESVLKDKANWSQKMEAKDAEITKLVRKVNTLQNDIQALQHTIARLSGAEDSGPLE
jgi:hypothetical protein